MIFRKFEKCLYYLSIHIARMLKTWHAN